MIFINNKYTSVYYKIIERSRNRKISGYTEKHHIIPKSLGGTNEPSNLVRLTAREHYICHVLLTRMTENNNKAKMVHAAAAFICWTSKNHARAIKINSRVFEMLKKLRQKNLIEEMSKLENKKKSSHGAKKLWSCAGYKQQASSKRKLLWKNLEYLEKMKQRKRTFKKVTINGIEYSSLKEAAERLNLNPSTISKRCSSKHEKFTNWNYI
jgi:hypothetical protein